MASVGLWFAWRLRVRVVLPRLLSIRRNRFVLNARTSIWRRRNIENNRGSTPSRSNNPTIVRPVCGRFVVNVNGTDTEFFRNSHMSDIFVKLHVYRRTRDRQMHRCSRTCTSGGTYYTFWSYLNKTSMCIHRLSNKS
jgi:hypothetical protein